MNAPAFNYSRVVDLSRPLDTGPDQHPWVRYETEIESIVSDPESAPPEGRWYVVTTLRLGGHAGTHVEAPLHAVENGASVGEVPVERFFGEAVVLDLTEVPWGRPLEPEVVQEAAAKAGGIRRGDILFLHFDWDRRKAGEQGHPFPSTEALEWLVTPDVRLVGIDSSGLEVARAPGSAESPHPVRPGDPADREPGQPRRAALEPGLRHGDSAAGPEDRRDSPAGARLRGLRFLFPRAPYPARRTSSSCASLNRAISRSLTASSRKTPIRCAQVMPPSMCVIRYWPSAGSKASRPPTLT